MTFLFYFQSFRNGRLFSYPKSKGERKNMNKLVKRLLTGTLAFATILTALPVTAVHASGNQYWTESAERVGYIEHVMNDGSIKSTFNEGHIKVEGETAYCVDINTNFKNGYKTRSDASTRMSSNQIADVTLSLEYVKQYTATHTGLNNNQIVRKQVTIQIFTLTLLCSVFPALGLAVCSTSNVVERNHKAVT